MSDEDSGDTINNYTINGWAGLPASIGIGCAQFALPVMVLLMISLFCLTGEIVKVINAIRGN